MPRPVEVPDTPVGEPAAVALLAQALGECGGGVGDYQPAVFGEARFGRALRGDGGVAPDRLESGELAGGAPIVELFGVLGCDVGEALAPGRQSLAGSFGAHSITPARVSAYSARAASSRLR